MDKNYWLNRWKQNQTGWHQTEVEPALTAFFSKLKKRRVLVPLCGKSLDLVWLAEQGHEVLGVELSQLGSEALFSENDIPVKKSHLDDFTVYQGSNITVLNGDFFKVLPEYLGSIDTVYDRAALIALPPALRPQYAAHICKLVQECAKRSEFEFLQIVLERSPADSNGPPFSISYSEIQTLYGKEFNISLLSREKVEMSNFDQALTEESVYRLFYEQ